MKCGIAWIYLPQNQAHIKTKPVQTASHLCLGEFAPVRFQVVNNAIKSSWQCDSINKQDHQDQIWEHSCEIYNLHTHTDTLLHLTLIFPPKGKTPVPPEKSSQAHVYYHSTFSDSQAPEEKHSTQTYPLGELIIGLHADSALASDLISHVRNKHS